MIKFEVLRNCGHPWDKRIGWDGMDIESDSNSELLRFIEKAKKKFWNSWIIGTHPNGTYGAFLYKPSGATTMWSDIP
jgi:hypothetical protein